jgi:penicillin-binding protein 1B
MKKKSGLKSVVFKVSITLCVLLAFVFVYLNTWLNQKFAEKAYSQPALVFARPLTVYPGMALSLRDVIVELQAAGYRASTSGKAATYHLANNELTVTTRPFYFWQGLQNEQRIRMRFQQGLVRRVFIDGVERSSARLEPLEIGRIHAADAKDRLLVKLDEVPESLIAALLATEDRQFFQHSGISLKSIARAMLANVKAGTVVQGGSTLTQQLVKNFFLSSERSFGRKGLEAMLALMLEMRASKEEILEAYINEVFIAQDGARAIHGFGLASQYLFAKPLAELQPHETAMLVAMLKGPSYYNPVRNPERAKQRRDLVLGLLAETGFLTAAEADYEQSKPLAVSGGQLQQATYPAYLDLVRRQLRRDYSEKDLATKGLRIFTYMDPIWQWRAQQSLRDGVKNIEQRYGNKALGIDGAVILLENNTSDVLALVGGKSPRAAGFNRALDAKRQIGSLVKPAVYLTALEQGFSLNHLLKDEPFMIEYDQTQWAPENFDKKAHGDVIMLEALAKSYNLATARLALEVGLDNVAQTLQRLGVEKSLQPLPSLSLGAVDLSPLDVAQMYSTISGNGFYSPLKTIRDITDSQGEPLKRYRLQLQQRFQQEPMYQLNYALQHVMHEGTGRSVKAKFSENTVIAGKTGTSDEQRDSWFAGFDKNKTAVVWLGFDDNKPMPITASSGALRIWADLLQQNRKTLGKLKQPETIDYVWVDKNDGLLSAERCENAVYMPIVKGGEPKQHSACTIRHSKILHWFKKWFQK